MESRNLGGLTVSALGLGCMSMSEFYGKAEEAEDLLALHNGEISSDLGLVAYLYLLDLLARPDRIKSVLFANGR